MANHPSAEKRHRQSIKKHLHNTNRRSRVHTAEKALQTAIENKDASAIQQALLHVESEIRRAKSKGVIHAKNASRKISRLAKSVHRAKSSSK
jgi:small subunit ribosomal protein S20